MKIHPLEIYEIVEMDDAICIIPPNARLQGKHVKLVRATVDTIPDFLGRYLEARSNGKSIRDAHGAALQNATVVEVGTEDLTQRIKQ